MYTQGYARIFLNGSKVEKSDFLQASNSVYAETHKISDFVA